MSDRVWYTNAGRLIGAAWQPSGEILRLVLVRENLWAALASLSAAKGDPDAVVRAVSIGDTVH